MIKKHGALVAFLGLILVSQVNANPPPGKGGGQSGQATSGQSSGNQSKPNQPATNPGNQGKGNTNQLIDPSLNRTMDLVTAGITIAAARSLAVDVQYVGLKPLPPGIAKNLARGKPLPPGIATRNVPNNLLKGLPHYDGYQWLAAGTDLLLLNTTSRVIADVLTDVLR